MSFKKFSSLKFIVPVSLILVLFSFLSSALFSKGLVKLSEAKEILSAPFEDVAKYSYTFAENDSETEMSPAPQGDVLSQ